MGDRKERREDGRERPSLLSPFSGERRSYRWLLLEGRRGASREEEAAVKKMTTREGGGGERECAHIAHIPLGGSGGGVRDRTDGCRPGKDRGGWRERERERRLLVLH